MILPDHFASNLEQFYVKSIILIFSFIIAKIILFYTFFKTLDKLKYYGKKRKTKTVTLYNNGRKVKKLNPIYRQFKYKPWDHFIHTSYAIMYVAMFIFGALLLWY